MYKVRAYTSQRSMRLTQAFGEGSVPSRLARDVAVWASFGPHSDLISIRSPVETHPAWRGIVCQQVEGESNERLKQSIVKSSEQSILNAMERMVISIKGDLAEPGETSTKHLKHAARSRH